MVSQEEKMAVLDMYPHIYFVRTMRQKSKRHHYFMEEHPDAMQLLMYLRGEADEPVRKRRYRSEFNGAN